MSDRLRVCSWNIQLGLGLPVILAAARSHHFAGLDLLALQEASVHDGVDDARAIATALGEEYDCFQVRAHVLRGWPQANALVWNSRTVAIESREDFLLPAAAGAALSRAERALLSALPRQDRRTCVLEGEWAGRRLRIYVAHLDVIGYAHKREQWRAILENDARRSRTDLALIAGDMNTFRIYSRPKWSTLIQLANAAEVRDLTAHIAWTHSVPRLRLRQKLDSIWLRYSGPYQYLSRALDVPGSDHIPVLADIEL